ncbi:MAG: SAM-dependent methyltransferase [Clostridiales bacterium]|nr:SAM-dependent methyltransferase [Clostridiales bacterium]
MTIKECSNYKQINKITISKPLGETQYLRITIRRALIKNSEVFQAEKFTQTQVFHENIPCTDLSYWLEANALFKYRQICVVLTDSDVTYLFSKDGRVKRMQRSTANKGVELLSNNRRKNYILNEGDDIPALIDLGIFTKDRKVVNSMFDKFKQINRFVEILDDEIKNFDGKDITLLDFGCGKSYLTFIIYHYLVSVKKLNVHIIGYDLKADVVEHCNSLARKYGYSNLDFVVADVSKDKLYDKKIDVVVSLHACDTATDYALHYAVSHNVPYIFSVPCCQHEVNKTIKRGGELDALLKYGIIKERVSALLTDTVRAMLLEDEGYSVDVMEFVDLAHSPKNLMLRARKTKAKNNKNCEKIADLMQKYQFKQTLFALLQERK